MEPATNVAQTTATLNGTVNAEGASVDECYFEYGETTAYGSSIPCDALPSGPGPVPTSASPNLADGSVYHYRLLAHDHGGAYTLGRRSDLRNAGPARCGQRWRVD